LLPIGINALFAGLGPVYFAICKSIVLQRAPGIAATNVTATGGDIFSTGTADNPQAISDARLRRTLLEYQAILDNVLLGITFTRDHVFLHCNQRFSEMVDWPSKELVGQSTEIVHSSAQASAEFNRVAAPVLTSGQRFDTELELKRRDGSLFWCRMLGRAIDPHDPGKGTIFITEDITERKQADETRRRLLLEYQAILDNASLGITFTRKRVFLHCNQRFSEMFGWSSNELVGRSTSIVYPSTQAFDELTQTAGPILRDGGRLDLELQMMKRDGSIFWCRMLAKSIDPTDPRKGSIYITEDITERKKAQQALLHARDELELRVQERTAELAMANARLQAEIQERKLAEQQIRYLANHDALTGLPNRRLLEDRLVQAMEMARRNSRLVAIQFIDLDRFKQINDRLGHRIGDLLLRAVGSRLRGLLRAVDTVSRVGGDEFVLVLPDMQSTAAACDIAQKVLDALAQPYIIEGHELTVTPSIGVSIFPDDGVDAETLIGCADTAMYHAKNAGRANCQLFTPDMKN
jgi:diguanylate cyclase (GGDEF)-like protein/PAS domain S-box-containing protein